MDSGLHDAEMLLQECYLMNLGCGVQRLKGKEGPGHLGIGCMFGIWLTLCERGTVLISRCQESPQGH